jgi:hypothetical protein
VALAKLMRWPFNPVTLMPMARLPMVAWCGPLSWNA